MSICIKKTITIVSALLLFGGGCSTIDNTISSMDQEKANLGGAIIKTTLGDIKIAFHPESPKTVSNFVKLSKEGFYDNTRFHRVIKDFMIQGGDPLSKDDGKMDRWGTGDPGYKFDDEFNNHLIVKGSVAMANSGPNTNGSQFFIVTTESTPWLDRVHTNFGYVVDGMDVLEKVNVVKTIGPDRPAEPVTITSVEIIE